MTGLLAPHGASAHDVRLPLAEIQRGAARIKQTLEYLRASPPLPPAPRTAEDHRRILGAAEIELALGNDERALQMIVARIADPGFRKLPEYTATLLLASQMLEDTSDDVGAMTYARLALYQGGTPAQMAEAGARWFRLARRHQMLGGRSAVYARWKKNGGARAAGNETTAAAAYEAAYALRADKQFAEAQKLLATVPSGSRYGSRAAYLAGVVFVEAGDLASAERWFTAVAKWPLPKGDEDDPRVRLEREVRHLAALSAGRLLYERGDLPAAAKAYASVPAGSKFEADSCYERAFLELERKRRRGALGYLKCVEDLGASGDRYVDILLLKASLQAHVGRYDASVAEYERIKDKLQREAGIVTRAVASIEEPAQFLFDNMERNAMSRGGGATPGPALLFQDAWTPTIDRGYRVQDELGVSEGSLAKLEVALAEVAADLSVETVFPALDLRRRYYRTLLRDIQHLQGHAGDIMVQMRQGHADASGRLGASEHASDAAFGRRLEQALGSYARVVEWELSNVDREERTRLSEATGMLRGMQAEIARLKGEARALQTEAKQANRAAAKAALQRIIDRLEHGAMRAEVGVLDTFWVRKEHVSSEIRALGDAKESVNALFHAAEAELASEYAAEEPE